MKRYAFLAVGVALCTLVVIAAQSSAQDRAEREFLGIFYSHDVAEDFNVSVGATVQNVPKRPDRLRQIRQQVNIPSHFGQLVAVTAHGDKAVLWFSSGGAIRNAVVDAPDRELYRFQTMPSTDVDLRAVR